jgi:hypothetical protein
MLLLQIVHHAVNYSHGGPRCQGPRRRACRPSSPSYRNVLNAARRSATSRAGCSKAAKCPPFGSLL